MITTIEDLIVLEIDRLEDHGVVESIPTMIGQTAAGISSTVLLTMLQERSEKAETEPKKSSSSDQRVGGRCFGMNTVRIFGLRSEKIKECYQNSMESLKVSILGQIKGNLGWWWWDELGDWD